METPAARALRPRSLAQRAAGEALYWATVRVQRHHFVLAATVGLAVVVLWPLLADIGPRLLEALVPPSTRVEIPMRPRPERYWVPPLGLASGWLNGRPIEPVSIHGRLTVLVTFSDTYPLSPELLRRVEAWHKAYSRYGVRVIGVHHPQFSFAADTSVLAHFAQRVGLTFPIARDPGRTIRAPGSWDAATSRSGVAFATSGQIREPGAPDFLIMDARDSIVARVWDASPQSLSLAEAAIRRELRRLRPDVGFPTEYRAGPIDPDTFFECLGLYLGVRQPGLVRLALRGPLATVKPGTPQTFVAPFRFDQEGDAFTPYPVGRWTLGAEGLTAARGGAANFLAIRYDSGKWGLRRVGVVASPPRDGSAKLWVLRDDAWLPAFALGEDATLDARGASYVIVTEPRLYNVASGYGSHVIKLSPESPGLTLHELTFDNLPAAIAQP